MVATSTVARQLTPPSMDRNERICPEELWKGTITVPLGRTTGWPPRPLAASPVFSAAPQLSPPLVERRIFMRVPVAVVTGLLQVSPPLVERLVTTAAPWTPPASDRASEEISQTLSWGS